MIKTTAITLLNQCSKIFILLYTPPIPETAYAKTHAIIITGIPVAMAKITGKYNPDALDMVSGTSIPKYNTPL